MKKFTTNWVSYKRKTFSDSNPKDSNRTNFIEFGLLDQKLWLKKKTQNFSNCLLAKIVK